MRERARLPYIERGQGAPDAEEDAALAEGLVVRDLRTNERFWMQDTIVDEYGPLLGADAFAIYSSLCLMANREQYCWPSLSRLARHWGKGKGTVVRAIGLLTDLGLIHVKRTEREDGGNSNNIYYLLEPLPITDAVSRMVRSWESDASGREAVIARMLKLLPEHWEPLRRKRVGPRTIEDWQTLVEDALPQSPVGPAPSPSEPGGSMAEPGGIGTSPAGAPMDRPSAVTGLPGSPAQLDRTPESTGPGLGAYPKDQSKQGSPTKATQPSDHHQGLAGVVLSSDEAIGAYELGEDEVLIETEDGFAQAVTLRALVRQDILATARNWGIRVVSECFYSVAQFLGTGSEGWTAPEEQKRAYHSALRRELERVYAEVGAFSLEEALGDFFSSDLVARYLRDDSEEQERVAGWLRYVRGAQGTGLENPAGFLRTRIESGQWPPRGASARHRGNR